MIGDVTGTGVYHITSSFPSVMTGLYSLQQATLKSHCERQQHIAIGTHEY